MIAAKPIILHVGVPGQPGTQCGLGVETASVTVASAEAVAAMTRDERFEGCEECQTAQEGTK